MSKSREQIVNYLSKIDIGGKTVLDVGCGPEKYWAKNFVNGKPKEYVTLDIDGQFGTDVVADLNVPLAFADMPGKYVKRYDVVFCLETLEHIYNPIQAVKNLYDVTREICYISVPFINPLHDKWDYLRYTPEWFEKVLPVVGFKKVIVRKRLATIGVLELMRFYREEGLRMSKIRLKSGQSKDQALIGLFVEAWK